MSTRYRDFDPQDVFPSTWADAVEDLLSGFGGGNLRLVVNSSNSVAIPAGADQARVSISINGKPRWAESNVVATVSGAAGTKDVFVTSGADTFSYSGGDETDTTDHTFALKVGATPSGSGAETNWRKIGEVDWDGAKITGLRQLFGSHATVHTVWTQGQSVDVPPIYAKGIASQAQLVRLDDSAAAEMFSVSGTGQVNAKTGYSVNGTPIASTNLSDGSSLAPKASPALTGSPTAPTVTPASDDSTKLATTAFVQDAVDARQSIVAQRSVLDIGQVGQTRAGRQLAVADFTDCGLSAPIGLWNLGSTADVSGNGRTLTNKGPVTFGVGIEGAAGSAAMFTGQPTQALYITDAGGSDPFRVATGSFGCWMRTAATPGTAQTLISKSAVYGTNTAYLLTVNSNNQAQLTVSKDGGLDNVAIATSRRNVTDDRWHFIVGTYDGFAAHIYVDGLLTGSASMVGGGGAIYASAEPFNIGARDADAGASALQPHFGRIDEAFVTNEVLTADQVRHLYGVKIAYGMSSAPRRVSLSVTRRSRGAELANGDFPSNPARAHNFAAGALTELNGGATLTATGGSAVTVAGPDGQKDSGVLLSGGAYLRSADTGLPSGMDARSFGCWVCARPHTTSYQNFIGWGTGGSAHTALFIAPGSGLLSHVNGSSTVSASWEVVADERWHHVAVVEDNAAADGIKRKLYFDGRFVKGSATLNSLAPAGSTGFRIGTDYSGAQPFYGMVSRAFVFAGALTSDQVAALAAKPAPSAGLLKPSPKDTGDHIEGLWADSLIFVGDDLEPHWLVDLEVSR